MYVNHCGVLYKDELSNKENAKVEKAILLLQYVLSTLHKCFLYDHEGFINKERFETLLHPLVDQLENFIGGNEVYEERVKNYLSPCIAQFAVAVGEDQCWKKLNYEILLKTRHSSAKVRFYALQCTLEICKKLGDDFTSLLPETIPFMAELMEDESFDVEQKCHSVISEMEAILGESLQSYF
ncbi:HEAT repeat-containing protein 1 [Nymphon striatum]|nr:HEAT repeat-containing protein 1 [Nymphon striatum]